MSKEEKTHVAVDHTPNALMTKKHWHTTVKLGAIEEANYAEIGDVVVAVNKASGELTLQRVCEKQPHGRSLEATR